MSPGGSGDPREEALHDQPVNVSRYGLQGASLLLYKDGEVVYRQHFGSYTDATVVPIASASKWPSTLLIMTLVDEGRLSLDDPALLLCHSRPKRVWPHPTHRQPGRR